MIVSDDCKYYAYYNYDNKSKIFICDFKTKKLITTIQTSLSFCQNDDMKFSPDGNFLVTDCDSTESGSSLTIWDIHSGKRVYVYDKLGGSFDISSDMTKIAVIPKNYLYLLKAHFITSSVAEQKEDKSYISPNPANDYIDINLPAVSMNTNVIKVFNVIGNCVLTFATDGHALSSSQNQMTNIRLDISGLPAGLYFVKSGKYIMKFVKI